MSDSPTDRIAREAARRITSNPAMSVEQAISRAAAHLARGEQAASASRAPTAGRVKRHVQAMTQQTLGGAAYTQLIDQRLCAIEEVMTLLTERLAPYDLRVVGEAARGRLDSPAIVHVRIDTDHSVAIIATALVEAGCEEPHIDTAETRLGRMNRLKFQEGDVQFIITRVPLALYERSTRDFRHNRSIPALRLEGVRRRMDELAR